MSISVQHRHATLPPSSSAGGNVVAPVTNGTAAMQSTLQPGVHRVQRQPSTDVVDMEGCCLVKVFISNLINFATYVYPVFAGLS